MPLIFNQWAFDISQAGNSRLTVTISREQFIYIMAALYTMTNPKNWEITPPIEGLTDEEIKALPETLAQKWEKSIEDFIAGCLDI